MTVVKGVKFGYYSRNIKQIRHFFPKKLEKVVILSYYYIDSELKCADLKVILTFYGTEFNLEFY